MTEYLLEKSYISGPEVIVIFLPRGPLQYGSLIPQRQERSRESPLARKNDNLL